MITVVIFILILGLLVFVHELGHFVVARRSGVRAEEFGFGFPPRIFGVYRDSRGKRKFVWGGKEIKSPDTIYSVNWIPLGGFVKIMGEDGKPDSAEAPSEANALADKKKNDPRSFATKKPFTRIKILAAGVAMNFVLAIVLFSLSFYLGVPQLAEEVTSGKVQNEKIQLIDIGKGTPAEAMGLRMGDEILGAVGADGQLIKFSSVEDVQNYVGQNKGNQIVFDIKRGKEELKLAGTPRTESPDGQGPLGIGLAKTVEVRYPWYQAISEGVKYTFNLTWTFITFLAGIIWRLVAGRPAGIDVSGPVGIAVLTGQVAQLGLNYLIRFTAMLSINLAIINILPIPALDGGRILFILIEKFKGSPVSQRFEQRAHNLGFALLITLMIFVTARDVMRFDILQKLKNFF